MMHNLYVGRDSLVNVTGKFIENISGNKESNVEKDKQTIINGKGVSQSNENHEIHSKKQIKANAAEKSNLH